LSAANRSTLRRAFPRTKNGILPSSRSASGNQLAGPTATAPT
jgi:hypothetical protein